MLGMVVNNVQYVFGLMMPQFGYVEGYSIRGLTLKGQVVKMWHAENLELMWNKAQN